MGLLMRRRESGALGDTGMPLSQIAGQTARADSAKTLDPDALVECAWTEAAGQLAE